MDAILNKLYRPYNMETVFPGVNINPYQGNPSIYGYVDNKNTSQININTKSNLAQAPQVLPHEMEHILQNRVGKRYGQGYSSPVVNALFDEYNSEDEYDRDSPAGITTHIKAKQDLVTQLQKSAADKEIPAYFQKKYNYPIKYFGDPVLYFGKRDGYSLAEQFAEISAAEQYLKKDLTIDPVVKERIFGNNDALIKVYKATTGLRTDRLDSKDLPPMQVPHIKMGDNTILNKFYNWWNK